MENNNPTFSLVIIGFNTEQYLKKLLVSIEKIRYPIESMEVVYIDDGSTDNSLSVFKNFELKYNTKSFAFKQNMGRVYASDKGIKLATGEWILNLQSNVVVDENILNAYCESINERIIAVGGKILYESEDHKFQAYLNHATRGINQYKQHETIKYQHLIFGNCIIKRSVFQNINLNLKFKAYGGEELEFAYRLHKEYPQQIIACKTAIVVRVNHPELRRHCLRLEEFGKINFPLLNTVLQQSVIKYSLLLKTNFILRCLVMWINWISFKIYPLGWGTQRIIQVVMLTSILKGFYKKIK